MRNFMLGFIAGAASVILARRVAIEIQKRQILKQIDTTEDDVNEELKQLADAFKELMESAYVED